MSASALLLLTAVSLAPPPPPKASLPRVFSPGHAGPAHCLAFSRDGKLLASGGRDGAVHLWEVSTGKRTTLDGHAGAVFGVAFSPDGKTLVACGGRLNSGRTKYISGEIKVWDVPRRQARQTLRQDKLVNVVAFSPDGKLVASGGEDAAVKLWDVSGGELRFRGAVYDANAIPPGARKRGPDAILAVAFSPDGKLLAWGDCDFAVAIWDLAAGREQVRLEGHGGHVRSISFSPDGKKLASAGCDYAKAGVSVKVWDVPAARALTSLDFTYKQTSCINGLAFDQTGTVLYSGSNEGLVKRWDWAAGKETAVLPNKQSAITCLSSAGGRLFGAARWDGSILLWAVLSNRGGR